jgi:hypothetical protein
VVAAWRRAWAHVIPFFAFPPAVRRVIYPTNAIESINARLRKIIKTRGHFPSDDAASKLIWLALRNITTDWGRAARDWKEAMNNLRSSTRTDSPEPPRNMRHRLAHRVGRSSQATPAAVDKSPSASHTKIQTLPRRGSSSRPSTCSTRVRMAGVSACLPSNVCCSHASGRPSAA